MGIIPSDLFRRGKSSLTIESASDWWHQADYGKIVATDYGKSLNSEGQDFQFTATATENTRFHLASDENDSSKSDSGLILKYLYPPEDIFAGGFDTAPIALRTGDSHYVWAAELQLYGLITAKNMLAITFTDGTDNNTLYIFAQRPNYSHNTSFQGKVNGISVSGVAGYKFNISADYNLSRVIGDEPLKSDVMRLNLGVRMDFDREEMSLWNLDQIMYRVSLPGLSSCTHGIFKVRTFANESGGAMFRVKQIGLRVDA